MTMASLRRQRGITLVELLVAITIMTILTTMIIAGWISLTKAYSFTSRSDRQRDSSNQAIARMAREIRDAQKPLGATTAAFTFSDPYRIQFYSTFNMAGNSDPKSTPRLTQFRLQGGTIYRDLLTTAGAVSSSILIKDVVNEDHPDKALFTYSAVDEWGDTYSSSTTRTVPPATLQTVRILLLVDLNPGKSPNYMDISTTVQPRNVRHQ
jgi:prepilin-type N-terminal cleavage/methylation domain-containing protein